MKFNPASPKGMMRAYGFSLLAMLVPAAMQFGLFAFYARALGAEHYGLYIALMSWSPICVELAGWGACEYLLKQASHRPEKFGVLRGHACAALLASLPMAVAIFVLASFMTVGGRVSLWTIAVIGIAECAGLRLLINLEQMAMSLAHWRIGNWVRALQVTPRLVGVAMAYFVLGTKSFEALAIAGSVGVLAAGLGLSLLLSRYFPPATPAKLDRAGLRQGSWFVGTQLVRASQQNIDRIVLAPLIDPAALAIYGAAQRFLQIGMLPLQAVLRISYAGFFKAGASGVGASAHYGLRVLPMALAAAACSALGLAIIAQIVPLLIGPEFALSAQYLVYLAPSLVLFAINSTFSDVLSGAGYLPLRLLLSVSGVALQVFIFCLMHQGSQIIWANYAGIGLSCGLTLAAVAWLTRRRWPAPQAAKS